MEQARAMARPDPRVSLESLEQRLSDFTRVLEEDRAGKGLGPPLAAPEGPPPERSAGGATAAPVQEMIRHGENGLLAGFFDVDGFVDQALEVLEDPEEFRHLGEAGAAMVEADYSLDVCLPRMLDLYERAGSAG